MRGKETLVKELNKIIESEICDYSSRISALEELGLNVAFTRPYLMGKENIFAADDLTLYYFTLVYLPGKVKDFFLESEIERYKSIKISEDKIDDIITLHAIQITDNQWIGRISAKELMLWRNASIINYNENAQRTMKHIISRGRDQYQIALNQNAVNSIKASLEQESFIPNTLTFNVPESIDIQYDDDSALLSFNLDNEKLDILDGYHRYIAISKVFSTNPDFDYNMEIRIVQFSLSSAQQFIWQEDQKTKMKKIQSDAMNQHKLSNQITQKVNENTNCDFYNTITANGLINKGYFSAMVNAIFCKKIAKKDELIVQKKVSTLLVDYLNWLATADESFLSKTWDKRTVYTIVFLASKDVRDIKKVNQILDEVNTSENIKYLFARTDITTADIKYMEKIVKKLKK